MSGETFLAAALAGAFCSYVLLFLFGDEILDGMDTFQHWWDRKKRGWKDRLHYSGPDRRKAPR